jgi:hypothetical protein
MSAIPRRGDLRGDTVRELRINISGSTMPHLLNRTEFFGL